MVKMLRKTKKALALALTAGMLVSATAAPVLGATEGWRQDSKGWWYQYSNGSYAKNKWEKINGAWYYFDANGYMLKDTWHKDTDGKWYYLGSSGAMKTNSWIKEYDTDYEYNYRWYWDHPTDCYDWYYVGASGAMITNDWIKDSVGNWYYFAPNGRMEQEGLFEWNGKEYYADYNGVMQTGVIYNCYGSDFYYFDTNGARKTGTVSINGTAYEFDDFGGVSGEGIEWDYDEEGSLIIRTNFEYKCLVFGIPCVGPKHGDMNNLYYPFHFNCEKNNCEGGKAVGFSLPSACYFSLDYMHQYFPDFAWCEGVFGNGVYICYREGNYTDIYNYALEDWNIYSTGTISTPIGNMKYLIDTSVNEYNEKSIYINGFVQVDSNHYIRYTYQYENNNEVTENDVLAKFTEAAQWFTYE